MKNYDFEVLAPVGNLLMLDAAIKAGADAVYLGGKNFSARAYAENFTIENIRDLVRKCHSNNIKVYVTVNTLLHDYELNDALNYIIDLYNLDVDAVIIQDLGLLTLIKQYLPNMDVHASTQININNYYGAKLMKKLGFKRIVLARETPIDEIKYIAENLDIELEVFIHGSLCISSSGQCLMSSYIGGRSGNRGKCAQPCRKEYTIYDSEFNIVNSNKAPRSYLSPKDLCTIDNITELRDIGIKSFKIEGRMKKPEYVYTVVKTYKSKLNNHYIDDRILDEVSNRGYTKGLINYSFGRDFIEINREKNKKGLIVGKIVKKNKQKAIEFFIKVKKGDILLFETVKNKVIQLTLTKDYDVGETLFSDHIHDSKVDSKVRRTSSIEIKNELENAKIDNLKDIDIKFIGKIGENPRIYAKSCNKTVFADSNHTVLKAIKQPLSRDRIVEQLSKMGNTNYKLHSIELELDENIFIPIKVLNELRRDIIFKLDKILTNFNSREYVNKVNIDFKSFQSTNPATTKINLELINIVENLENDYGDIYTNDYNNIENSYYKIPRIATSKELEKISVEIKNKNNIKGFLVNNLGDIQFVKEKFPNAKIIGDIGLNVLNSKAYWLLKNLGLFKISLSTELNIDEINDLITKIDNDFEILVHGYLTSMVMKNCPFSILKGCKDDSKCNLCKFSKNHYLKNNNNEYFLVNRFNGYSELYHNKILDIYDIVKNINLEKGGNLRIIAYNKVDDLIKKYNDKINNKKVYKIDNNNEEYTKGHFLKGIN
ncbi:U32 family peptidase [Miniphocaeibacter halophilus]|uniref:U32 family peptidase n=1 Tax=Miniphocaeibacter halophilus TaxID=2931922 RepID=A0AC61MPP6_9FIRM|nr:U32 family peptidase [Miniphocaeibacter halophilus]QQK07525.1 U32 family peptidase [Miniphocaeibacter halophilus]